MKKTISLSMTIIIVLLISFFFYRYEKTNKDDLFRSSQEFQMSGTISEGGLCSLDYFAQNSSRLEKKSSVTKNGKFQFYGFGYVDGKNIEDYVLRLKPSHPADKELSYYAKLKGGVERKDIVSYFHRDELINSGYYVEGDFNGVENGEYSLSLLMNTSDGVIECPLNFQISLN